MCNAPILLGWNSEGCLLYDMVGEDEGVGGVAVERCRTTAAVRWEAMVVEVEWRREEKTEYSVGLVEARAKGKARALC